METNDPLLTAYVKTMNARDSDAFSASFAADAIVHGEGHKNRGTATIKSWIEDAWKKYDPKLEVARVTETAGETILTGLVSGTFDGSPLELHHHLTIAQGQITALTIRA